MAKRKLAPALALSTVFLFIYFLYHSATLRATWQRLPQRVGLGDHVGSDDALDGIGAGAGDTPTTPKDPDFANWNPKPIFKPGSRLPGSHNYTSTLVVAKTKEEDIEWMEREIPTQHLSVYVADDPTAPLHPPKNKGHEVMMYLSYIIDHYDTLPDVSIFVHSHQFAWHNDEMMGHNAAEHIRRLSPARVWREGFVNVRCSWFPGCPDWMHPGETEEDASKQEQVILAKSWSELFPLDEVPQVLAQPCCAQFALSRERIQAKPLSQYVWYREWLFSTTLPDFLSGRVWEYVWQFVFTGSNIYCPKEHVCLCDLYGYCFGGEDEYNAYITVKNELGDRERDLREWEDKGKAIQEALDEGKVEEAEELEKPEEGKDEEFKKEIDRLRPVVDKLKKEAEERGNEPSNRAKEAGREWQEGDGF